MCLGALDRMAQPVPRSLVDVPSSRAGFVTDAASWLSAWWR